jgi:sigma-B regulation protein RsbU (phosphoserine phosphatase)
VPWFKSLSNIDKTFLIALVIRVAFGLIARAAGIDPPGFGVIQFVFIVIAIIFLIRSFPKWTRAILWRVRHRLLVTWIFVGVVPIVLICLLIVEGMFVLMGQIIGYMTTQEIARQNQAVRNTAQALAIRISNRDETTSVPMLVETFIREQSQAGHVDAVAVRVNGQTSSVPADGLLREIPNWSNPEFAGLIKNDGEHYLAAHVQLDASRGKPEVFLSQRAGDEFFSNLLPGVARVEPVEGVARAGGINVRRTERRQSGFSIKTTGNAENDPDIQRIPSPPARGWWDMSINWIVLVPDTDAATGKKDEFIAIVASRSSLVLRQLFSTLGGAAGGIFGLMLLTAVLLLIVEFVSVLLGFKLTRSITRVVADLYEGTRKVQAGDFSHRIPLRKTKDQLRDLAGSFNTMTERIQDLIVDVKEKERLENELAIARDVQSQLFPKEIPRLKTLELWGGCQPARMVSGDYYDFFTLGTDRAALAIGDISGKGISAALLMAHIQSALRSQFLSRNGHGETSPAGVISILNNHLYTSSSPEKYATLFLGFYADDDGGLIYTNAGHLAPMLVRRGEVLRLAGDGFPVGLFPGVQYEQQSICLEPGDLLVGFTDGVTETPNESGEEFGDQRLTQLLAQHCEKPLDRIATEISSAVGAWAGDVERHDDTTLLLARRL